METLKKLRKDKNLSQLEVAKYLGTSQQNYCRYENGDNEPDINTLIKLATFFHVSVDYLIGNEQPNKVDLTSLSETKKDCIEEIQSLTEEEALAVTHFIAGLKQKDFIYKRG